MFIQTIKPEEIFDRLNAEAYLPEYIECAHKLQHSGLPLTTLGEFVSKQMNNSIRGITGELDFPGSTIPMFRPADISGGYADPDSAPKLSANFEADHEKSRVYPGDLVLGIAGTVGCVGRVPANVKFGNINGSSARIATSSDQKSAYLLAYLQSRFGQASLLRYGVGSVQKHLNLEDLPIATVCNPDFITQNYIGDKIRQAERLRAWAKSLEINISNHFSDLAANPQPQSTSWRTSPHDLDPYRINPKHYDPVVLDLIHRAEASGIELQALSSLTGKKQIAGGATPKGAQYVDKGIFFARVQNVKPLRLDLSDAVYIDAIADQEIARSRCDIDDVILTITGYPGTASLVTQEDLPININQHSVRFNVKTGVDPAYICAALNSRFLKYQVERLAIGGTRDSLDYPSVGNLLIPRFSHRLEHAIAKMARNVIAAIKLAQRLTTAAKLLVEALIEGHLSEAELIAAQQQLEAGDTSLDRAILSRLKTDGLNGTGQPLFADLDELYVLLAQAAGE